ncbi:metallophosphoesterase family protein [Paenibacillus dakarensis]|uniref:metallophosphoesterase family protein n=1 Tax=Paenibacillus dakarensis TaxID=1527293 RepID=UPI0006D52D5B|nr:DNA repair exonuclease [Paenibacillus dakarensis]
MLPFRFIHAADLHLDSPFAGLSGLTDQVRKQLQQSTFTALDRLVQLATTERVDFVVISGDIYDSANTSLRAQLRFMEALKMLDGEQIPVFIIHGNHDPLDSPRLEVTLPPLVHTFGAEPESVTVSRRSDGQEIAVISGMSYPTSKVKDNISLRYSKRKNSDLFHIGLLHANVDGDQEHETYAPCTKKDLIGSGYHYWALGHIHSRRILHELPYIVYPGNIQGRHIRETGPKGCYLIDVDEDGTVAMHFRELDTVRWSEIIVSINDCCQPEDFRLEVEEQLAQIASSHTSVFNMVRIRITGRSKVHQMLEDGYILDDMLNELRRKEDNRAGMAGFAGGVWVESFRLESGADFQLDQLLQEDSFIGEMLRMAEAQHVEEAGRNSVIQAAMKPLMEQAEMRQLLLEISIEEQKEWLRRAMELNTVLLLDDQIAGGSSV